MKSHLKKSKTRHWSLILFGLPFAAVGIIFLVISVVPTLYDWVRMSSWEPVQAEMLYAKLESHRGDDATTYGVTALYRYRYAGQSYEHDRVAINTANDNVGRFQQDLGYRLESAWKAKRDIQIWVNPEQPQEAIIDRTLRLSLLLLKLIFVVVFGGVGIGLMIFGWRVSDDKIQHVDGDKSPWLTRRAWANNNIRSEQKMAVWFTCGFAAFWNAIAFPVAILALTSELHKSNYAVLVVLIFPAVGLGLAYWAIKTTLDWRRFGDPVLVLDPFPGAIGGHFGALLELPLQYSAAHHFKVILNCLLIEPNSGSDNETRESLVWQVEGLATVKPCAKGSLLTFRFDIPKNLPASEPEEGRQYHRWRVDIESQQLQPSFSRSYTVPVYVTAGLSQFSQHPQHSTFLQESAETHPEMQAVREAEIDAISDIEQVPGGVRIYLPYGRNAPTKLMGLFFGMVFASFGWLAGSHGAPLLFPIVFGGVGGGIFLYALYSLTNCLLVQLDQQGLTYERRILGAVVARANVPRQQIKQLIRKESYSSQSGNKHVTFYRVQVKLFSGKTYTLADSLRGRATADQMLEAVSLLTGYASE